MSTWNSALYDGEPHTLSSQRSNDFSLLSCLDEDSEVTLHGDYFSKRFDFIQMRFRICDVNRGETCAEPDEIDDFFRKKPFQVFYTDTYIDQDDSFETIKSFV